MVTSSIGVERLRLLAALEVVEAGLHAEMRAMREAGATWYEICVASGYTSVNGVKKIVLPGVRSAYNEADRKRRQPIG
jgi:hypothetical protein